MKLTNAQRRLLDRVKADGGAIRQVDMTAYEKYNNHEMTDYIPTDEDLAKGFAGIPDVNL